MKFKNSQIYNFSVQQNQRAKLKPIMKRPSNRSVSPRGNTPKVNSSIPNQKITDTGKRNIKYLQEELQQRVEAQKLRNFQIVKRDGMWTSYEIINFSQYVIFELLTVSLVGVKYARGITFKRKNFSHFEFSFLFLLHLYFLVDNYFYLIF